MKTRFPVLASAAASIVFGGLVHAETAYFLMSGPIGIRSSPTFESYVVTVNDAALIAQARERLRSGTDAPHLVPHVKIAMGVDPVNLNYAEPERPVWSWHVTELLGWTTTFGGLRPDVVIPNMDGTPSNVPRLLAGDANTPPVDNMTLVNYPLVMELMPGGTATVANVSSRGWVGTGERVLIVGFIVQGNVPRNVVVRGIGPSLAAFGVAEPLSDPKITVFRGSEKIAENDNWEEGNFTGRFQIPEDPPPWYAWLFPSDPKEAAFQLSLPPGAYTVHVSGVDSPTGIALAEVFDLDALNPQ